MERLLGHGGMGAIYEVTHVELGRRFIAKTMRPELQAAPELVERFRREAQAVAALHHMNIVQVTDFAAAPEGPAFLVMEKLEGRSLGDELDRFGALAIPRACKVMCDVLNGLEVAHAQGIVHRDLKPSNVFLVHVTGVPETSKLLDFGLARVLKDSARITKVGQVLGTPGFLSPEQARGSEIDHRADLFACGTLFFVTLANRLPWAHRSAVGLSKAVVSEPPLRIEELRQDVPPELVHVIARALAKPPEERFQSAREMRTAIEPFAQPYVAPESAVERPSLAPATVIEAGRPSIPDTRASRHSIPDTRTSPGAPVAPTSQRPRRRWHPAALVLVALLALGMLVAGAGVGYLLYRRFSPRPPPPMPIPMPQLGATGPLTGGAPAVPQVLPQPLPTLALPDSWKPDGGKPPD